MILQFKARWDQMADVWWVDLTKEGRKVGELGPFVSEQQANMCSAYYQLGFKDADHRVYA